MSNRTDIISNWFEYHNLITYLYYEQNELSKSEFEELHLLYQSCLEQELKDNGLEPYNRMLAEAEGIIEPEIKSS